MSRKVEAEEAMLAAIGRKRPRSRWGHVADGIVGALAVALTGYLIASAIASWW